MPRDWAEGIATAVEGVVLAQPVQRVAVNFFSAIPHGFDARISARLLALIDDAPRLFLATILALLVSCASPPPLGPQQAPSEPASPDAAIAEAQAASGRGEQALAKRLFAQAAIGMIYAGSPPRWELPGPLYPAGDAIFLGSGHVASVAGTHVVLTEAATGVRRLLWPHAASKILSLTASENGRFLAAKTD